MTYENIICSYCQEAIKIGESHGVGEFSYHEACRDKYKEFLKNRVANYDIREYDNQIKELPHTGNYPIDFNASEYYDNSHF